MTSEPTPAPEDSPYIDPVIEVYLKDVDRTLLREMLKKSVTERLAMAEAANYFAVEAINHARERRHNHSHGA